MKNAVKVFFLNFLMYYLLVFNYRSVSQARYVESVISDMFIAWLMFTLVKKVSASESILDQIAYVLGGGSSCALAIYTTQIFFGQ